MRIAFLIAICFLLTQCTALDIARGTHNAISQEGAEAADLFLRGNVKELCQWATIGSLEREYGEDSEQYRRYHLFCRHKVPLD